MPDNDTPVPVTSHVTKPSPGACTCNGVTGTRTAHTLGQPGCNY